jgi:preprotein translocase subunit SecG
MLHTLLMIIHFFCAAAIVALVLLQRGKGAEAGAGFGAGASGTVFGARGASTALSRATAILAAIVMVTSLSLAYVGARKSAAPSSLLDQLATPAMPAPAAPGTAGAGTGGGAAVDGKATPAAPSTTPQTPAPASPATSPVPENGKAPN